MSYENNDSTETRSPLKAPPLRYAGQSLDEEMQRLLDDEAMPYAAAAVLAFVLAIYEWWRWYANSPPNPVLFTLIAIGAVAYAARKIVLARRKMRVLRLGRDGERIVGQFLEGLREAG